MDGLIQTERSGSGDEIRVDSHERVGRFGQSIPGVLGKLAPAGEPAKEFTPGALVTEGSSGLSPWSLFRAASDFEMGLGKNHPIDAHPFLEGRFQPTAFCDRTAMQRAELPSLPEGCAAVWHFSSEFPEAQSRLAHRVRACGQDG